MSDRLAELVRQRALVQEHLAWLDREIARASQKPAAATVETSIVPLPPLPTPPAKPGLPPFPAGAAGSASSTVSTSPAAVTPTRESPADADEILEKYRAKPGSVQSEVRKGCFLYFIAAFVLLGAAIAILYFAIGSRSR